jgi:hypothetical protein
VLTTGCPERTHLGYPIGAINRGKRGQSPPPDHRLAVCARVDAEAPGFLARDGRRFSPTIRIRFWEEMPIVPE